MAEYISRDELRKHLADCMTAEFFDSDMKKAVFGIDVYVENMPAADVQPVKHGRWIEQRHTPTNGYNYNVPYSIYVCSICGLEIHNDEYSKYVRGTYTNCPVCTARMDVSE